MTSSNSKKFSLAFKGKAENFVDTENYFELQYFSRINILWFRI